MRYVADLDYHIHSYLSLCSDDPLQTNENILEYAKKNGFSKICLTDHFWDESIPVKYGFYNKQDFAHISKALPLPESKDIEFCFGCETEMDKFFNTGISEKLYDKFNFIIVPTTHLHFNGFTIEKDVFDPERRAYIWAERFDKLLSMDMPFHKMGMAHLTCPLILSGEENGEPKYLSVLRNISDEIYCELFEKAAKKGIGIELNFVFEKMRDYEREEVLRPYRIAKHAGCKFYLGSDAHHPEELAVAKNRFEMIIDALELSESDKFVF